jgi:RNA polymerase sigma factor (sigma-70 family)
MSDRPPVTALVTRAAHGDQRAWDALVERYAPLIWSICRRYQLGGADAGDVGQAVWLQLLDHLGELREPAAVGGWLATTTRRECARARREARKPQAAAYVLDPESNSDAQTPAAEQELLVAERDAALREAFTRLPSCCQQLIAMLTGDQPLSDAQLSAQLGIPAGSIGPRRGRCLGKLRRDPAITALPNPAATSMEDEPHRQAPIRQ